MAYFHNRTVNLLNLHYLIGAVAMGGGGAFYAVYLLKAGLSIPGTLATLAVIFMARLVLRSFLLPLGIRLGLRRLVILGSLLMGASYPFLAGVDGIGIGLGLLIFTSALADTIYWPSYHAYFAALGDEDHRGQQLGVREGIAAALGIVSPLAAGWLLVYFGPAVAFGATGIVQALSAVPIAFTPDIPIARHAPGAFRAALRGVMLFVGDGWVAGGYFITWQIALFVTLGENYLAYGGALAVSALVGGVGGLFLGRLIDSGQGTRAVWLAVGTLCFVIALRIGVLHHPALAVAANALGALVSCLYVPTLMTAVYNQAKRSPCVLRFHIAAEGGWDVGVSTALGLASLIVWSGLSIANGIALGFVGAAIVFVLAWRYYRDHPAERIEPHEPPEFAAQPAEAPKI